MCGLLKLTFWEDDTPVIACSWSSSSMSAIEQSRSLCQGWAVPTSPLSAAATLPDGG